MSKLGERASEVYKKTKSLEKRDKFLHKIVKRVLFDISKKKVVFRDLDVAGIELGNRS